MDKLFRLTKKNNKAIIYNNVIITTLALAVQKSFALRWLGRLREWLKSVRVRTRLGNSLLGTTLENEM
ncbi:hypothetical protein T10_4846 [Trichinella papuae]|uniref:Uncharacterized protein n=1 Tax=Trichinella papuae TaxID=268474 RepID=A0A0V1N3P2_9BILA|nr:hypothetical protein T10_4846 [Trichinella papuae]